ncbi:hypothetical protein [Thermodesulfatator indicus]
MGEGDLCDIDLLKEGFAQKLWLASNRFLIAEEVSEYLCLFDKDSIASLSKIAAKFISPVIKHEISRERLANNCRF